VEYRIRYRLRLLSEAVFKLVLSTIKIKKTNEVVIAPLIAKKEPIEQTKGEIAKVISTDVSISIKMLLRGKPDAILNPYPDVSVLSSSAKKRRIGGKKTG
jgi:hypothetical protein